MSEAHPERDNQDRYLELPTRRVFGVFDGMGGHADAALAAAIACEEVETFIQAYRPTIDKRVLPLALQAANKIIMERNKPRDPGFSMGTTGTLLHVRPERDSIEVSVAQLGDSPVFIVADGRIDELTENDWSPDDDPDLEERYKAELLITPISERRNLSHDAKRYWAKRGQLGHYIGREDHCSPRIARKKVPPGARAMMVSDGISDNLFQHEIATIVTRAGTPEQAARDLITVAKARCQEDNCLAKPDDMTAIVIQLGTKPKS